jgi:hypothetical protein
MAKYEWEKGIPPMADPIVTPAECWVIFSVFPQYHKLVGD